MESDEHTLAPEVYALRLALYVLDSIFSFVLSFLGLFIMTLPAIGALAYFDLSGGLGEGMAIVFVPLLGMATFIGQFQVSQKGEDTEEEDSEREDLSLGRSLYRAAFVILYQNLLMIYAAVVGGLVLVSGEALGFEMSKVFAALFISMFTVPYLDISLGERRWWLSLPAIIVASVLAILHDLGKVTWVSVNSLPTKELPVLELWREIDAGRRRIN